MSQLIQILAVEDDVAHAELIRRAFDFATSPMRLSVASSLAEARRSMAETPPDLMIVDMLLPDGRGTELLPGDPDRARCPMVIMTSHGDEQMAVDALKAGALDYVVKSPETLTDMPHIAERTLREWGHIRDRRLAEDALRQSEEQLQSILDNAPMVVYVRDVDGRFLTTNHRFEELYGVHREDIVGQSYEEVLPAETAATLRVNDARVIETGGVVDIEEGVGDRTYESAKFPLRDASDEIYAVCNISNDITERKKVEREREILEAQLRQAKKLETIGTLAGGIAHDFNNILSPILGFSEMALEELEPESQAYSDLQHVLRAGQRAKDLVEHILVFSRQAEPERRLIEVHPTLEEAQNLLKATLPTTIEIRAEVDTGCGLVRGDSTQLLQLVMNLCTNAYHAMRETGGVLGIRLERVAAAAEPQLNLAAGAYVRLTVRDTGHGMDQETLERIFDPFFTMKEVQQGTGLGLSVVHGIVKSHEGEIVVESELGAGTTFHIYLPLAEETAAAARDTADDDLPIGGSEHVFLVDDDEDVALMERQMLERLGYRVSMWTSSEEALEAFRDRPRDFDVVITDQTMPGVTGGQLATEILSLRPGLPIILTTGFSEAMTPEKSAQLGIRSYLMKPVVARDLDREIRRVLNEVTPEEA